MGGADDSPFLLAKVFLKVNDIVEDKIGCHFKMFHQCSTNLRPKIRLKIAKLLIFKESSGV